MADLSVPEGFIGNPTTQAQARKLYAGSEFEKIPLRYRILRRFGHLDQDYYTWRPHFIDLASNFQPRRGRWLIDGGETNKGWRRNYQIVDSTPLIAARTAAAGTQSGVTSPARPWFKLITDDVLMAQAGVKEWLYAVERAMRNIFAQSNLYNSLSLTYLEFWIFGVAAIGIFEHPDHVINAQNFTIGSYRIANNASQRVDTFYRLFRWTVRQIVQKFLIGPPGEDASWVNISARVRSLYNLRNWDTQIDLIHAIEPREDDVPKDAVNRAGSRRPYRDVYLEQAGEVEKLLQNVGDNSPEAGESKKVLRQSGWFESPVLVARFQTNTDDAYGESPAMHCLGDARALQIQQKRKAQAIDKLINPPMTADSSLRNQRTSLLPGDVTFVDPTAGNVGFKPAYEIRPDVSAILEDIKDIRERIQGCMFSDIFALFIQGEQQEMTATEVSARQQEKLLMLGPVLEQLNYELLDPLIRRTFKIMARRGLLPEMPDALKGAPIQIQYVSILHQAQNAAVTGAIAQMMGLMTQLREITQDMADHDPRDKVDFDELIAKFAEGAGAPATLIRSDDDVAQIRMAKQQQVAAAAQAQQQLAAANAAPKITRAASDIHDMLGGGGGGAPGGMQEPPTPAQSVFGT